jgi:hypothetical protein
MTAHTNLFSTADQAKTAAKPVLFSDAEAQSLLDDLNAQLVSLRTEIQSLAAQGANQVASIAHDGADGLRDQIRKAPVLSLGLALVAGSLIAIAVTARPATPATWRDRIEPYRAQLPDIDVNTLMSRARQAAHQTGEAASSIVPGVERLAQAIASMDATTLQPAIERGSDWVRSIWGSVSGAMRKS